MSFFVFFLVEVLRNFRLRWKEVEVWKGWRIWGWSFFVNVDGVSNWINRLKGGWFSSRVGGLN